MAELAVAWNRLATSQRWRIAVVEDNAQGLFGRYKKRALGSFGDMSAVSFHGTKNISCGEGGALLLNNGDLVQTAEVMREKGTDRAEFLRGQKDKYTWRSVGSSYIMSDVLASILLAQLEAHQEIQLRRKAIWDYYCLRLQEWARDNDIALPTVPADCEQTYHLFYVVLPTAEVRRRFIAEMQHYGIQVAFHYQSLHLSPMGRKWGYAQGDAPVTERMSEYLVRLPLHPGIAPNGVEVICDQICSFVP